MANQRMYIRCQCGKELPLAKRMGIGFYAHPWATSDPKLFFQRMNDFFDEHEWCGGKVDGFDLSYEQEREF